MIEARFHEGGEFRLVEWKAAGDEADVEAGDAGGVDEFDDVGAGQRFATGEIDLQDAGLGRFLNHAHPGLRGKLRFAFGKLQRVGAIDAVQRAAVGEFGDESEGCGKSGRHEILVARAFSLPAASRARGFSLNTSRSQPRSEKFLLSLRDFGRATKGLPPEGVSYS